MCYVIINFSNQIEMSINFDYKILSTLGSRYRAKKLAQFIDTLHTQDF